MGLCVTCALWLWTLVIGGVVCTRPNIIIIIADDLGWNDVGFHGLNNIPTPNIDALAASGIILNNYYVQPVCSPSRSAFMTGKYPIHTGMQHGVLYGQDRRGLPLSEKILPQYLKELGYTTHLVGKWHLGSYKKEYLPLHRGFDSHLGFWTGKIDMYDHTNMEKGSWGFDFRKDFETRHDLFGRYATDIYTEEAVQIIETHNKSSPLFLMVSHSAVHSGNPSEFIRAPDGVVDRFRHINDTQRRKFAAVLSIMDESIGEVVTALNCKGLLENSVILFTTDNGGVPAGFNDNAGSNFPLRGTKNTLWEGGVRGVGVLWSPLLEKRARVAAQTVHITDWLPTLLATAGYTNKLEGIDGKNQWNVLSQGEASVRKSVVLNIDEIDRTAGIIVDSWKLVQGTRYNGQWDGWYGPDGRDGSYDIAAVYSSPAAKAIRQLALMPPSHVYLDMREKATLNCGNLLTKAECRPAESSCLFDLINDPCELNNLADTNKVILNYMLEILSEINRTVVPAMVSPLDPQGDPKFWARTFVNFGDYQSPHQTLTSKPLNSKVQTHTTKVPFRGVLGTNCTYVV